MFQSLETGDDGCESGVVQSSTEGELQGFEIGHDVCDLFEFIGVDALLLDGRRRGGT